MSASVLAPHCGMAEALGLMPGARCRRPGARGACSIARATALDVVLRVSRSTPRFAGGAGAGKLINSVVHTERRQSSSAVSLMALFAMDLQAMHSLTSGCEDVAYCAPKGVHVAIRLRTYFRHHHLALVSRPVWRGLGSSASLGEGAAQRF